MSSDLAICTDINYGLHSPFDIKKHKETFNHYLEVIILKDGTVMYAVPSHTLKATALAQEKLNKTKEEISKMCPREFYSDYLNWLLSLTDSVAVWEHMIMAPKINKKHVATLRKLKINGLYIGVIPEVGAQERGWL